MAARAEAARRQVDDWVAAQYQQADASSVASALAGTRGPQDVADRLQLQGLVSAEQATDLEGYERARVDAANADSRARAAAAEAADAASRATAARDAATRELAAARAAVADRQRRIAAVTAQRDAAEARLATLEASDAALAAQRRRAEAAQAAQRQASAAADAAARDAARARLARAPAPAVSTPSPSPSGPSTSGPSSSTPAPSSPQDRVQIVLDRARSELGTTYAWGGGNADGPTRGIRDGGVADAFGDFDKVGFDCSGLMVYAFAGVGITLPHYSGYQIDAGPKFPLDQRKPGDMLFWADDNGVHHVALYLGDDEMVEAPESGKVVRIAPVRFDDEIVPTVTRLLGVNPHRGLTPRCLSCDHRPRAARAVGPDRYRHARQHDTGRAPPELDRAPADSEGSR